ncbi:MAG: 7-carboxy-7-deazaguanine synthase QueE [Gammaproteobacteria bacterium]|jgi:7-carboxy-7-deazaguanine synthase|nr:7-carboxy-7-deazaguanine synthase QueE [Gammaproteobacteria bacterium]MBT6043477.1 7-carboxy-7-deazaguanine synthase QueE [Gammaproteobacteria bacterium]
MSATLRISEIFYSLQGEARTVGRPTIFIRLTGCPLRCQYCDTAYAFSGGIMYSLDDIIRELKQYKTRYITVTGGEPLAQPDCIALLNRLCEMNYEVSLETSGAMDVSGVDSRVVKVLDLKTPGSLEVKRNMESNIAFLNPHDQVKFVICSREDYLWSCEKVNEFKLGEKVADILFSPSNEELEAKELAEWILADQLDVRMQVQLHKYLWGNESGH